MLKDVQLKWQTNTFDSGAKISAEPDTLWLIKQGAVKTITYDLSGTIIILGYWGKGDVVGQSLSQRNIYEMECLTPVKAERVPYRCWDCLAKEIRKSYQDIENIIYILRQETTEKKLIELLVYLSSKFGIFKEGDRAISLPLTHKELADFFGVTRASIVMAINKLQSKKILDNPRQGLIILHISKMTEFEYKI